jgi:hypothetical protein
MTARRARIRFSRHEFPRADDRRRHGWPGLCSIRRVQPSGQTQGQRAASFQKCAAVNSLLHKDRSLDVHGFLSN